MLFHPMTLKLLYEWKSSKDEEISLGLLALIMDGRAMKYNELDDILYKYKEDGYKKKKEYLKSIVESKFIIVFESGMNVFRLKDLSEIPESISKLLKTMRNEVKKQHLMQCDVKANMLNFTRVEKKEKIEVKFGRFLPIYFNDDVIICSPKKPINKTVRIREDIQDPKKLIFVKFCDEFRPPIYKFKQETLRVKNSISKLPQVLDYDYESELEEEEIEDIESISEYEEETDGSEQGWIDVDVENMNPNNKKPSLTFPSCKFTVIDSSPRWNFPLIETNALPDERK